MCISPKWNVKLIVLTLTFIRILTNIMIIHLQSNSVPLHFVQIEHIVKCIIASIKKTNKKTEKKQKLNKIEIQFLNSIEILKRNINHNFKHYWKVK